MIQRDSEMNFNSVTFIGLTHAEVLRTLDPNVLPGIIRLSTILQNRYMKRHKFDTDCISEYHLYHILE